MARRRCWRAAARELIAAVEAQEALTVWVGGFAFMALVTVLIELMG